MRDHTTLKVFALADSLAIAVYHESRSFPESEKFGLQSQMRRAAVSVAANIVEGCARSSQAEYLRFIEIAYSSTRELEYEIGLSRRLGFLPSESASKVERLCTETGRALNGLLRFLRDRPN
jgi:four helix bundle protein